jgi:hypothetical protein
VAEKKEPAKSSAPAEKPAGADDWADSKVYKDNPDKPDPTSVAQVEVLPEDK